MAAMTQPVKKTAPKELRKGSKRFRNDCKVLENILVHVILDRIPTEELEGIGIVEATEFVIGRLSQDGVLAELTCKDVPPLEDIVRKALRKRVLTQIRPTTE